MTPKIPGMASNLKEAITETLRSLGGCGTISQVSECIRSKYGQRWRDIGTAMADMCPESKSSLYSARDRVLKRVGKGKYCLANAKTVVVSRHAQEEQRTESQTNKRAPMSFSFRNAENILREKEQISTIIAAASLTDLSSQSDHDTVQGYFSRKGWSVEVSIFPVGSYRLDAFRQGTGVEIERSLIDAIHRSLFRCIWAFHKQQLQTLVLIVPTYKEPKFSSVKRDIEAFKDVIPFPIYLIGVSNAEK